jgi:hypothetical protein
MESMARGRLIRVAARPAGAEGIGSRIRARGSVRAPDHLVRQFPMVPSLFFCPPRNLSREVGVGEGREREREEGVGEEDMAARSPSGR